LAEESLSSPLFLSLPPFGLLTCPFPLLRFPLAGLQVGDDRSIPVQEGEGVASAAGMEEVRLRRATGALQPFLKPMSS
jgi:hypothetical protein